ncbi:hypothetical protein D7Y13_15545 [Corallococcus praedator]|uniref:Lipoprotein n=1 Tax=Corallococcus praedator TaxID=2316724 RepID=A0ABX9QHX7_9BACT|nr:MULTISPECIES: hypothetical protein [Corallococcus]RKH15278.1 hypothetical protein D7X74_18615 [Corallococcus sp. CA047B]RKH29400.1 hypothetical protein D7X75_22865 [Corallococcus sp. CA031C]RKI08662.1 hypothetical protein D7Y13_15545 [Corallococcus praedator]
MMLRWLIPLLLVALTGCGSITRSVRLDTGRGSPTVFTPRPSSNPVKLDGNKFEAAVEAMARFVRPPTRPQEAARRLFEVEPRSGSYLYEPRSRRITPLGSGEHLDGELPSADVELTRAYLRWCDRTARPGDCLRLLVEGPTVTGDGRYALSMALAQGVVLEEMMDAFKDMADPEAMITTVLWTWTTYMILLAVPEPFSKGIAAVMTATLIAYVGVDTFWNLIVGFKRLVDAADRATTFDELRAEGERYGKVMGRNAARAFAMLATAAIGSSAAGLAKQVPMLPGAAQAAVQAESQMGFRFAAIGEVETVAVSAEAVTISLAPGAVAMAASGNAGTTFPSGSKSWGSFSGFKKAMGPAGKGQEWHHIVEQTPGNVNRFGPQAVHNTENILRLDKGVHTRVSSFFSSIQRDITGSATLTVRQWLSTRSYATQREFGLLAIERVTKGFW